MNTCVEIFPNQCIQIKFKTTKKNLRAMSISKWNTDSICCILWRTAACFYDHLVIAGACRSSHFILIILKHAYTITYNLLFKMQKYMKFGYIKHFYLHFPGHSIVWEIDLFEVEWPMLVLHVRRQWWWRIWGLS